jgi:importin subunit alpha-6/7
MVDKVPSSHLLLTTIAALSALQAEISWDLTCKRLPDVLRYIQWPNDKDELDDACRSLDYMLKRYNRQQLSIPTSVMSKIPFLIRYLTHSYRHVQRSSRGVLNTIASGTDEESQALLDANILDILNRFLNDPSKCAQACTTISKLTAGNSDQIARIMNAGIMRKLINIITNRVYDLPTWKEAAWGVTNALDGRRSPEQFKTMVVDGAIEPICKMLANHSQDFALNGDEGQLKSETTFRLLRCLDQATIHLPTLKEQDQLVTKLLYMIEGVFQLDGYRQYRRESKSGMTR